MPASAGPPRRPVAPPRRRGRVLLPTVVVLVVLLIAFSIFTSFYTDLLWFRSVGYSSVFSRTLAARTLLFLGFGLVFAAVVAINFVVAYRTKPAYQAMVPGQDELDRYRMALDPYRRLVVAVIVTLLGLIGGSAAAGEWRTYLQWRNGVSFDQKDVQFGMDISFFAFDLPWYRFVLGFAFATVVVGLIAAAVTHYLYGGLRLQPFLGERATPAARVHLSVLMGVFVLLKAVGYWLDRYGLAVGEHRINKTELHRADLHRRQRRAPGQDDPRDHLADLRRAVLRQHRAPHLAAAGHRRRAAAALGAADRRHLPGARPAVPGGADAGREGTAVHQAQHRGDPRRRTASTTWSVTDLQAHDATADQEQLAADADTTSNIRLLDPQLLSPTYKNLQQIQAYYDFPSSLDVDRYAIDGETTRRRDGGPRAEPGRPARRSSATGSTTTRLHPRLRLRRGAGRRDRRRPARRSSPPTSRRWARSRSSQPRIYFGEESPTYSIVGGPKGSTPRELDFPDDTRQLGSAQHDLRRARAVCRSARLFNKLLFAMKYQEANILLSGRVNTESKILYVREPQERVEKVAPWLTLDGDPYPAVVDGRIVWIVDGYTTSNGYPYSTRSTLEDATTDSRDRGRQPARRRRSSGSTTSATR